jgi:hypothetical protein
MRNRKLIIGLIVFIVILVLLHLVPIYNKNGYIDHSENGKATCIGYDGIQPHHYKLIANDFDAFKNDKNTLKSSDDLNPLCGVEPVNLRLYIL